MAIFAALQENSLYETVIGLEIHAQLLTRTKLFCGDPIAYGAAPNTQVSPITLAHPGTLPRMNKKAVAYAIKMGLALGCEIERQNFFARKNYFYPDLPKGYQVSQHTTPICKGGFVKVNANGEEKTIRLNRIHLEEDAGKSLHDVDENASSIDYNRAGTPLIEIVTEPDLRSADEAFAFVTEVRKLVRYLGICDGNMEEGSLRCDANISVRKKGDPLGTKVEIKNLNSIRNVKRAIEIESARLMELIDAGETIQQQTRSFDANNNLTFAIRDKEDADDYRYFPEPDLSPFDLENEFIESIRQSIPSLPAHRMERYIREYRLSPYDAQVLTEDRAFSDLFEKLIERTTNYKAAANWMAGPVKNWLNEHEKEVGDFPLSSGTLATLVNLVDTNKLSFSIASTRLFSLLLKNPGADPVELAGEHNLLQESDQDVIAKLVDEVLAKFPEKVNEYRKGKKGLLALFVGEVMKRSEGKADPKRTNELLLEKLK